jgi:hypothetical protein
MELPAGLSHANASLHVRLGTDKRVFFGVFAFLRRKEHV